MLVPGVDIAVTMIESSVAITLTYGIGEAWIAVCRYLYGKDSASIEAIVNSPELREIFLKAFQAQVRRQPPSPRSDGGCGLPALEPPGAVAGQSRRVR